jgi:hypothetical protein
MKITDTKKLKAETQQYIAFLEKRLASASYKKNSTTEEFKQTQVSLSNAKLKLKVLSR